MAARLVEQMAARKSCFEACIPSVSRCVRMPSLPLPFWEAVKRLCTRNQIPASELAMFTITFACAGVRVRSGKRAGRGRQGRRGRMHGRAEGVRHRALHSAAGGGGGGREPEARTHRLQPALQQQPASRRGAAAPGGVGARRAVPTAVARAVPGKATCSDDAILVSHGLQCTRTTQSCSCAVTSRSTAWTGARWPGAFTQNLHISLGRFEAVF